MQYLPYYESFSILVHGLETLLLRIVSVQLSKV